MKNFLEKIKSLMEKVKTYFKNFLNLSTKDKIKVLLQWPALCCSAFIFLFFLIVLIVNCTKPYSNSPYTYEESIGSFTVNIEITLDNNGKATTQTTIKNASDTQQQKEVVYYEVVDGKLMYSYTKNSFNSNEMGNVNAFGITVAEGKSSITLVNHGEEIARAIYIVFMLIGVAGAAASGFYIFMIKRHKSSVDTQKDSNKIKDDSVSVDESVIDDELVKADDPVSV